MRIGKLENIKHPELKVKLTGMIEPNAFLILGLVGQALRIAKVPVPEVDQFYDEAMKGDFDNLMKVAHEWVEIE